MKTNPDLAIPCRNQTDLWFDPYNEHKAAAACTGCPVYDECRAFAYDNLIEYGVWGGSTAAERREEWRPFCSKGCGSKARQYHKTCTNCGKPGRPRKKEAVGV